MEKHSLNKGYHNPTYGATFTLTDVGVEIPWSVLSHFNIVEHLKSENIIVVENKDNTDDPRIISTKEKNVVKEIIKKFVTNNIHSKPVQFQSTLAFKLLLVNDKLNQNVKVFLQCLCGKSVLLYVDIKSQMCYLYTNVKNELLNLQQTLECAIVERVYTQSEIEYIHAYIERWYKVAKLIPCCTRRFATKFVATRDVINDLDSNAIYEHYVKVTLNETELLVKCQELYNHLIDLSKDLSVIVVSLEKQENLLILKGTKKSVRELMSKLRNMYIQIETSLSAPVSKVHLINDELLKVSNANSFSVNLAVNSPKEEVDVNGEVIASWLKTNGHGVYLVQGDFLTLNVDVIVILSTTNLFPLYHSKEVSSELLKMTVWKDCSIGECIFSQNNPQRCMIPVHDNRNRRNDAVWEDQLHKCFSKSIWQIIKKGLKTVAIHASVIDENLAPHFLQTFIETSIEHDLKSYICCESYEEITRVHNIVQESLLLGGQELGRNLHYGSVQGLHRIAVETNEDSIVTQMQFVKKRDELFDQHHTKVKPELLTHGLHKMEVKIRKESIFQQEVEVLVNTADTSLDLQKGQVSKLFYERAGKQIQDECDQLCPKGLPPRNCTVTSAGDLAKSGVRIIVHCVLPVFDKTQFQKDVKDIVKLCLMYADRKRCKSIAFPSIGMGKLGYPVLETKYAMLQAVEEYRGEAVCSTIETVVFTVYGQEQDLMFEQFDRVRKDVLSSRKKTNNLLNIGFPGICKIIDTVKICVTSNSVRTCLPESAIEFNVTVNDQGGEVDIHLSKGHIVLPSTTQHFMVEHAVKMVIESKVMDVVFCIWNGTTDTVVRIISAVENSQNKRSLRNVYILLASQELLEKAQNNFCSWRSFFTGWTKTKDDIVQCSMKMMTLKKEAEDVLSKCQKVVASAVNEIHNRTDWNVDESFEIVGSAEEHDVNVETLELSAQINPGIVKYLRGSGGLETWLTAIQEAFSVFVKPQESSEIIVSGSIANVTLFEQYLLTGFPNPPSPLKRPNANTKEGNIIHKTDKLSNRGTNNKDNVINDYEFGEFTVTVCHGNIADSSEDCIISPTHRYINKTSGVAKELFEKGGQKYKEACKKLELYGPMYVTECRVSDGGNLKCKKVIHVRIPYFDRVNLDTLNLLEKAIINCLETAAAYGLSTVAMPAVGTGSGALSAQLSSEQISRAIHHCLKEKRRLVTHITIVILPQKTSESFKIQSTCDAKIRKIPTYFGVAFGKIQVFLKPMTMQTPIDAKVVYTERNQENLLVEPAGDENLLKIDKLDKFHSKFIIHFNMPVWTPIDNRDITQFETEIFCKTEQLMQEINDRKWNSVALPLFCEKDNQDSFKPPLRRICGAMIRGLRSVKKCKNIISLKLYIISSNNEYLEIFYDLLENEI